MDVFSLRKQLVEDYERFARSFTTIRADDIRERVDGAYKSGRYWPEPLIQLNPRFEDAETADELVATGALHAGTGRIFRDKDDAGTGTAGVSIRLRKHQRQALAIAARKDSFVVTTGTGSGKSLCFFIPIIDAVLRAKDQDSRPRTRAIIVYPMNALANSQFEELKKFPGRLSDRSVSYARYTGQESDDERHKVAANPPDILLTNFMMLELLMTRQDELDQRVIGNCENLEFLVLDELHTYRGRQGADVAMLVRRVRERLASLQLVCIGTSATMASEGGFRERNATVARVASKVFATEIPSTNVVTETLIRATDKRETAETIGAKLSVAVRNPPPSNSNDAAIAAHPLAIWVETTLGVTRDAAGKWERAKPRTVRQAIDALAETSGESADVCEHALTDFLLLASRTEKDRTGSENGSRSPFFAFKLHQFLSGAGSLYVTFETPVSRRVELEAQEFLPSEPDVRLYETVFCRDCGHEYHPVRKRSAPETVFLPRSIDDSPLSADDHDADEDGQHEVLGFLTPDPRLVDPECTFGGDDRDYPEEWQELSRSGEVRLRANYRKHRSEYVQITPRGTTGGDGYPGWFSPGKFRYCLRCGETWGAQGKDITRLASLSAEGRSSATTTLTWSALSWMHREDELQKHSRKLLGFTDNRQDAALQAGHFNDFIFVALLRAATFAAVEDAGADGLARTGVGAAVQHALGLDADVPPGIAARDSHRGFWMSDPDVGPGAFENSATVLRKVIAYRMWLDQRRGWRYTNPTLEKAGLISVEYSGLEALIADDEAMASAPGPLPQASRKVRRDVLKAVLDHMREGSAVEAPEFDRVEFERLQIKSQADLLSGWAIHRDEHPRVPTWLTVGSPPNTDSKDNERLLRGGFQTTLGRKLRRGKLWDDQPRKWTRNDYDVVLNGLLELLRRHGLVVKHETTPFRMQGWRIASDAIRFVAREPDVKANPFFVEFYRTLAAQLRAKDTPLFGFEAREHTAQVKDVRRALREKRFRFGTTEQEELRTSDLAKQEGERTSFLPLLFCSPTMELGVDISALNAVYLRNVPPTPANYAQRSGRAGRSGMAALVVTYCSARGPHDQYYFRRPDAMVHGQVRAPLLDLANRDLIASHLHSVWLASTKQPLPTGIAEVLDLSKGANERVRPELAEVMHTRSAADDAKARATRVLRMVTSELTTETAPWFTTSDDFASQIVDGAPRAFEIAFERWRSLYRSALHQRDRARETLDDHTQSRDAHFNAKRDQNIALDLLAALREGDQTSTSDFYLYRYLATEGFLPGYNFPRLPLLACIPGEREKDQAYVQRPRFLALSEFGPRALLYHEGRTYRVVKVRIGGSTEGARPREGHLPVQEVRVCRACGAGHFEPHVNECHVCGTALQGAMLVKSLLRIEHVDTRPTQRITADDEERQRGGFDVTTTFRWPQRDGVPHTRTVNATDADGEVLSLQYAASATVTRLNLGLRRRREKAIHGFHINPQTGWWTRGDDEEDAGGEPAPGSIPPQRVVPFVEEQKNALHVRFSADDQAELTTRATLQHALRRAIEVTYQLEEGELLVEPVPDRDVRAGLLFYEATEGGAGVLTRIVHEPDALAIVAREALKIMHLSIPEEPAPLPDVDHLIDSERACVKGCYRCLLSYYNQTDHDIIDRRDSGARALLVRLTRSRTLVTTIDDSAAARRNVDVQSSDGWIVRWSAAANEHAPTLPRWTTHEGKLPKWPSEYAAVTLPDTPAEMKEQLELEGTTLFPFSAETARWPDLFIRLARHLSASS